MLSENQGNKQTVPSLKSLAAPNESSTQTSLSRVHNIRTLSTQVTVEGQ